MFTYRKWGMDPNYILESLLTFTVVVYLYGTKTKKKVPNSILYIKNGKTGNAATCYFPYRT